MKKVASPWQLHKALTHTIYRCSYRESKQFYLIHRNKHREAAKLKRQGHLAQMKEQHKIPEKELDKVEIANLSDAEFKTLVIKILREHIGYFNSIKKTQAEMKLILSEIKKNL